MERWTQNTPDLHPRFSKGELSVLRLLASWFLNAPDLRGATFFGVSFVQLQAPGFQGVIFEKIWKRLMDFEIVYWNPKKTGWAEAPAIPFRHTSFLWGASIAKSLPKQISSASLIFLWQVVHSRHWPRFNKFWTSAFNLLSSPSVHKSCAVALFFGWPYFRTDLDPWPLCLGRVLTWQWDLSQILVICS